MDGCGDVEKVTCNYDSVLGPGLTHSTKSCPVQSLNRLRLVELEGIRIGFKSMKYLHQDWTGLLNRYLKGCIICTYFVQTRLDY